ncbi:hypothetical protein B7486_11995 [cyanobacterium TDX16]|nr:hypothetical protein B7486_11995 [cyanobacterium TDX16]
MVRLIFIFPFLLRVRADKTDASQGRASAGRCLPPVSTGGGRASLIVLLPVSLQPGFSRTCFGVRLRLGASGNPKPG